MLPMKLEDFEKTLPPAPTPAGNYVSIVQVGSLLFTAGVLPLQDGKPVYLGTITEEAASLEQGRAAARLAMMNLLGAVRGHLGSLNKVVRVVKLTGFVNCAPSFGQQAAVINGASDLLVEVFGDAGRHVRSSIGAASLPRGASVEIEAVFQVKE